MPAKARDQDDAAMIGSVLCDTYRVTSRLGVGAMGTVYEAEQIRLKRQVALKVLALQYRENIAALKRFHNEVRALVLLDHEHIARILDFAVSADGRPFLVMERLHGSTVGDELASGHRFSVAATVDIALQVGEALVAAHAKGIIHRDLKPDNLFLCTAPGSTTFVKVLDFGISRLPESEGARITTESEVLGTPEYMSPEQAQGRNDWVNGRADQHALALVMYEMLSGVSPFAADDVEQALKKIALDVPPLVSDHTPTVSLDLALVLRKAMSKDPLQRYVGIDDFIAAVTAAARPLASADGSLSPRSEAPAMSMTAATGAVLRDPVRTLALIISRARAAFAASNLVEATSLATAAVEVAEFSEDEAVVAVRQMAEPLLESIFGAKLEPMDRRVVNNVFELGPFSPQQAAFLSTLEPRTTIAEAVRTSVLPRLDALRVVHELEALGGLTFQPGIPRPRSYASMPAATRGASVPPMPRILKRA